MSPQNLVYKLFTLKISKQFLDANLISNCQLEKFYEGHLYFVQVPLFFFFFSVSDAEGLNIIMIWFHFTFFFLCGVLRSFYTVDACFSFRICWEVLVVAFLLMGTFYRDIAMLLVFNHMIQYCSTPAIDDKLSRVCWSSTNTMSHYGVQRSKSG